MEKTNFLNKTRQQGGKKLHFLKFLPQERKIKLLFFSFQELLLPTPRNYHHCQKVDLRNYFLRRSGIKASGPPIASILTGLQAAKDFLDYEGGQSGKRILGGVWVAWERSISCSEVNALTSGECVLVNSPQQCKKRCWKEVCGEYFKVQPVI